MAFEIYQQVIYIIINLFALLAAIFSINTFLKIRRQQKQPEIRAMLSKVFLFFSVGVMLWVIAEFGWDMSFYMYGELPGITFLDLFWMAGYFFLLPAFAYFNIYILQKRQNMKKGLAVLGIATVVFALIIYYIIKTYVLADEPSGIETFVYLFYAVGSGILVTLSFGIYTFFRQIKEMSFPLLLLAVGATFTFLGDLLFAVQGGATVYQLTAAFSDLFYAAGYGAWALAAYLFSTRLKVSEETE